MAHIRRNRIRFSGNSDNDIISNLPAEILLEILDKLPTEDAMTTAILSPKWRNLWKILPRIELSDNMQKEREKRVVGMVNKFIKHYEGNKMKSFHVSLKYNTRKRKTYQSWIAFAATKNVEELHLDFHSDHRRAPPGLPPSFELPHNILNCASLVRLHLESVGLILLPAINLESLKELELVNSQLSDDATKVITKNCPKLESLFKVTKGIFYGEGTEKKLDGLLENFQQAKVLYLCSKAITSMINPGKEFTSTQYFVSDVKYLTVRDMTNRRNLLFNCHRLSLDTGMQRRELPGIAFLLKACPRLETLVIVITKGQSEFRFADDLAANGIFVGGKYWKTKHNAFKSCLQRLAAVEFVNLWGTYQTWDARKFDPKKFFRACQDGYDLLIFLMENSPSFERFIFTTSKKQEEFPKLLFL
ncbi:hypothetical protein RJ640_007337 [Escallonia rubra]|uniref:F-box domain-containing protein n=1 Tax=Escallonia rubra TaxID=112253 RepID=A0AA88UPA6_9ASTE|nr:hypothetical protein RJ640_007337 [Escallonia rubra]